MAQFAVLIYAADSAHDPTGPAPEKVECDEHAEALVAQVAMTHAWAFTPREHARSVTPEGSRPGPYVDSPHVVAGVYILEAPSLEVALAIASQNPVIASGGGVEVRPVHSGGAVD